MTAIVESPLTAEQAESLEAAFLGGLEEAQFAYERIVEHEAWILLGFDRFADWWDERVTPTMRALSMRPTREIAAAVVERVREEEAELPPAQRRTQRELADMVGISTKTLQRQSQDRPQETLSSGADLEPGDSHAAAQYRCFGCTHIWPRSDKGNTCPKCGGWGVQHQERKPKDDTALPAHQEHADAALAAIDEWLQHQASAPPRIEPPDPEVRERLAREREEQNSREAISRDLARCVWLLAEFGRVVDAPDKAIREWQPSQDIYPAKTTAARLRQAADYLYALAERWPQ